jgi:two-component system LytT family response regulator
VKKTWKAVIIDDERLARNKLRRLLENHPEVEILGEADGVKSGVRLIEKEKPEVVFLDIQMPNATGFDLLDEIKIKTRIIFVTAFDEYAIRAFEVNALDYLLKPINSQRLSEAIERLSINPVQENPQNSLEYEDYFFINTKEEAKFIKIKSIKCIIAADVYSEVFTETGENFLLSKPLNEWELQLPERNFVRIHRSTIINLEYIERIEKWFNYSYQVHLKNMADPFVISRRYASKIKGKFGF